MSSSTDIYLPTLDWMKSLDLFSEPERKVLLALSHEKFRWRTRERLLSVTGLSPDQLDSTLAGLIAKEYVRPSFSKKKDIIFALRERLEQQRSLTE
ncbi:MAG TPA: hypothetical protein VI756_19605 [Blastocatellia bacterium]